MKLSSNVVASIVLIALITLTAWCYTVSPASKAGNIMNTSRRIIYYHQNILGTESTPKYLSLKPIWTTLRPDGKPYVTQLYLSAFNMGASLPNSDSPYLHLNDIPPSDSHYDFLWTEVGSLQKAGVEVMMLLGGAGAPYPLTGPPVKDHQGYYYNNNTWGLLWPGANQPGITYYGSTTMDSTYYTFILDTLTTYKLDGIGLDFETGDVSGDNVQTLITTLRSDYKTKTGNDLIVSLTPVASGLTTSPPNPAGLGGFNYQALYSVLQDGIDSFNGQFYNGFGSATDTTSYENIINTTSFPADKVVLGACLMSCGSGGVADDYSDFKKTVKQLSKQYPNFGGVFAWLYTDSVPGSSNSPVQWAEDVYNAMQNDEVGGRKPDVTNK